MSKTGFFNLRLIKSNSKLFINLQNWKFEGLWLYTPWSNTTMGVGTWNVGTNRNLALCILRGVPWHWVRHNVWGFSSCSQRFDMSDVQISEWLQNKLQLEDLCMTNLSTSTILETSCHFAFIPQDGLWGGGVEFAQFEHWSLRRGQGRPGNIICAHSCCCRQYKKSFLVPIYLCLKKHGCCPDTLWTHVMHSMVL
jgi:hypothetical protein